MHGLGAYPNVPLARAREKRDAARRLIADGINPSMHRKAARSAQTDIEDSESEAVVGELLGLLPDSRRFEMRLVGADDIIKGSVAAAYASPYLERIEAPHGDIVGQTWRTRMRIREIRERNKPPRKIYTLIGLLERIQKGGGQQPARVARYTHSAGALP